MKNIMLKIIGSKMNKQEEQEQLEFVTEGKFYCDDEKCYIVYDESEVSGMPGFQTSLSLNEKEVTMRRFSPSEISDTEIKFQKGERYEGIYETPFGSLQMEVLTNNLINNIKKDGTGYIDIDYDISLRGLTEGRTKLNIEILEREVQ